MLKNNKNLRKNTTVLSYKIVRNLVYKKNLIKNFGFIFFNY